MYKFNIVILLALLAMFASMGLTHASGSAVIEDANLNGIVLTLENKYYSDSTDLTATGLANNSFTINGAALKVSKGIDINQFIGFTESQITDSLARYITNHNLNGTTDYILLDMEGDAGPRHWGRHLTADQDDDGFSTSRTFLDIVNAYKLRISVARSLLPDAKICLYGMPVPENPFVHSHTWIQQIAGFTHAGTLGLFDDADYIVPVCYMRFCEDDYANYKHKNQEETTMAIQAAQSFVDTDGNHIDVFPLITPTYFGNSSCVLSVISADDLWEQITWIKGLGVDTIGLWVGNDTLPRSTTTVSQYAEQLNQAANQDSSGP
ncbi:MAG: hypothetical protein VX527_09835 [Planctomycetota bacterium]|nr:hypothetical protein [Planctomycetota bacterium]